MQVPSGWLCLCFSTFPCPVLSTYWWSASGLLDPATIDLMLSTWLLIRMTWLLSVVLKTRHLLIVMCHVCRGVTKGWGAVCQ